MHGFTFNPDPVGHPTFRIQHPTRLEDLRLIAQQSQALARSQNTGGINDIGAGMGYQSSSELMPQGWWARLTSCSLSLSQPYYSWLEVQDNGTGQDWTVANGAAQGTNNACELNKNASIAVPSPPSTLTGTLTSGGALSTDYYYYTVTATWVDYLGNILQSAPSPEIEVVASGGDNTVVLQWTTPASLLGYTPGTNATWPDQGIPGYALTGYKVWRGTTPGGENLLLKTLVGTSVKTYTDDGSTYESQQSPIPGGNAGPVVWMSPRSGYDWYRFYWPPEALPLAWVKPTTTSSTNVTLSTGGTLAVYAAVVEIFSNGTFSDSLTASWFYEINDTQPSSNRRYPARLLAMDQNGLPIWATASVGGGGFAWVQPTAQYASPVPGRSYAAYPAIIADTTTVVWMQADWNNEYQAPTALGGVGTTVYPIKYPWTYQARVIDSDSNGVAVYEIASWHEANWIDNGGSFVAWAGLVSAGSQTILGPKTIIGPPTNPLTPSSPPVSLITGGHYSSGWMGGSVNAYGNVGCVWLSANNTSMVGGSGLNTFGGYETVIFAYGNIAVEDGLITYSANGQWPTAYNTGNLPDSQFLSFYAGGTGGASIGVGQQDIFFSGGGLTNATGGVATPGLFIGTAGQFVEGLTGTTADGSQCVSGLVVAAGGSGGGIITTNPLVVDGGSDW